MSETPTRGAHEGGTSGWVGRPVLAALIRVALFIAPLLVGWMAVRYSQERYWQPPGRVGTAAWIGQAVIVAGVASHLGSRLANRLAPVTALFKMTLVFPDHAPSRFSVALRSGTVKRLRAGETLSSTSVQAAAEHAIALVAELGRHERLTRGHTERVRAHAELIGVEMGLPEQDMNRLRWGVLLHDIGKLTVPAGILNKEEKLTDAEWEILKGHPAAGDRIIAPLRPWLGSWADAAAQHHERWDGQGYPAALRGTEISLSGRITAVADAYDVITSNRSYKQALSVEAARRELVECSGRQFDPAVVRAMLQVGLRPSHRLGVFSWILELPQLARIASNIATAPAAAATAVVSVTAAVSGTPEVVEPVPVALSVREPMPFEGLTGFPSTTTLPPMGAVISAPPTSVAHAPLEPIVVVPSTTEVVPVETTTTIAPTTTTTLAVAPTTTSTSSSTTSTTTTTTTTSTTTTTTTTSTTTSTTSTTTTTLAPIPTPTGTGFRIVRANDLPPSLSQGSLQSATQAALILEAERVTLTAPLTVKIETTGVEFNGHGGAATTVPVGTIVCSWFLHTDQGDDLTDIDLGIQFTNQILGVAPRAGDLQASSRFELPGVAYDYKDMGSTDRFTFVSNSSLDGTIVHNTGVDGGDVDQMRIITAC